MQKNVNGRPVCVWACCHLTKIPLVMKLTAFLLTIVLMNAHATGTRAQYVSISGKEITLTQVFSAIKKQTGYVTLSREDDLLDNIKVSLTVSNMPLRELLDLVLKDQPVEYAITDKTIFLSGVNKDKAFLGGLLAANPVPVSGKVSNTGGLPVSGATIRNRKTKKGTTSDTNGNFSLEVSEGEIIDVSFVGLSPMALRFSAGKFYTVEDGGDPAYAGRLVNASVSSLLIELAESESRLQEVTINAGYYKTTQRTKVGNITRIDGKDIEKQPVTSLLMALQGRVPGLLVTPNTGVAGSAVNIQIRGTNSLRDYDGMLPIEDRKNTPLFIVDGIVIDARALRSNSFSTQTLFDGYDPLSTIDPANIQSIEVLKDADATAIYGSRGANGVILITTKKAQAAKATDLEIRASNGFGKIVNRMDLLNAEQYITLRKESYTNDGLPVPSIEDDPENTIHDINGVWDQRKNTNWQDVMLGGTARITDAQISLLGGNSNTSFFLNTGYHRENVIYSGDFGFDRLNSTLNLNHLSRNQKLRASASLNYGVNKNRTFESGSFISQALTLVPNAPDLYDANGDLNWEIVTLGGYSYPTFDNPMAKLKNTNTSNGKSLLGNLNVGYTLLPGLELSANAGFSDLSNIEIIKKPFAAMSPSSGQQASMTWGNNRRNSWIIEPLLSYNKTIGGHSINATVGATLQEEQSDYLSIAGYLYTSDDLLGNLQAAPEKVIQADFNTLYRYTAAFARLGYEYKNKYLLNLTGRRDGSSRFGPGRRFGNFGAVGAGWIFTEEPVLKKHPDLLSFGKIRASYGVTGNDQIGDYKFFNAYGSYHLGYQGSSAIVPTALYNPDYSWESTRKMELGLELGFLKNRIRIETSLYRHRSSNQLINYQLPMTAGFEGVNANFEATVQNEGIELMLMTKNIQTRNFSWTSAFNTSRNSNKLIAFPGLESSTYSRQYKVGYPLSVQRMYTYKGVNPETGMHEVADLNNDGIINDADRVFGGTLVPGIFGGLTNTLSWRGLDLSFQLNFSKQRTRREIYPLPGIFTNNLPVEVMQRWQKKGDITSYARATQNWDIYFYYADFVQNSDYMLIDASFIRLKNLSLSWRLPANMLQSAGFKSAALYLEAYNLLTITNLNNFDPETGSSMPPLRMLVLGFNIKL